MSSSYQRIGGGGDGNQVLADLNLTVVLRKRNATVMSMGTARDWLETCRVFRYPYFVR